MIFKSADIAMLADALLPAQRRVLALSQVNRSKSTSIPTLSIVHVHAPAKRQLLFCSANLCS